METATKRSAAGVPKDIQHIPEFRQYLARENLTYAKWEARQKSRDAVTRALEAKRQKLRAYRCTR